jgi:hypothetical protein
MPTHVDPNLASIAKPVFLAWERLRVIYVFVLAVVSIVLLGPSGFMNARLLLRLFEGAVVANVLIFAGPVTETYVHWLGFRQNWLRWVLFFSGALLSVALAIGVVVTGLMLEFD